MDEVPVVPLLPSEVEAEATPEHVKHLVQEQNPVQEENVERQENEQHQEHQELPSLIPTKSQPDPTPNGESSKDGKKAVHVKWAGKTIALGTFQHAEADEKCARAKALTRAWRSTMRPKPNREWVMLELERLQVRVVSGRLGRKVGGGDDSGSGSDEDGKPKKKKTDKKLKDMAQGLTGDSVSGIDWGVDGEKGKSSRRNSLAAMAEAAALSGMGGDTKNLVQQRPGDPLNSFSGGLVSQNQNFLTGANLGGAPSSFEKQLGLSVNPNQHYEMLKLHHMNLLNEIQETTLMMNLYQQQQLQQQQQQLQQQQFVDPPLASPPSDQILQLAQQQQLASSSGNSLLDSLYGVGGSGMSTNPQLSAALASQTGLKQTQPQMGLGLGSSAQGTSNQMQALLRQQNLLTGLENGMATQRPQQFIDNQMSLEEQEEMCQARLQKLKQDIAEQRRPDEADSTEENRRMQQDASQPAKRVKLEEN